MHLKLLRVAASTALCGGIVTLGLVPTQAALATTPTYVNVPCSTSALVSDMTSPANNTVLILAPFCTYWLTSGPLPSVTNELTIVGHGDWIKRSYALDTPSFSIFVVGYGGDLILRGVNVANGGGPETDDGGAIDVTDATAYVTIYGGTFLGNHVLNHGGAIFNIGTLTVNGTWFTGNSAGDDAGAIWSQNGVDTASINHATFSHNWASDEGGAIYNNDNNMTVTDSFFRYNHAYYGGAIYNDYDLTVVHSQFGMNSARWGGAFYNEYNLEVDVSLIATNFATGGGGGILNDDNTPILNVDLINLNVPDNCEPVGTIPGCTG